mmetsp:Transcript_27669/g.46313  ORF Transcript_27669/g.46313 Transcript_27669/m.46313 type:complete len:264 (-) Transcript_27669:429-1220(-)
MPDRDRILVRHRAERRLQHAQCVYKVRGGLPPDQSAVGRGRHHRHLPGGTEPPAAARHQLDSVHVPGRQASQSAGPNNPADVALLQLHLHRPHRLERSARRLRPSDCQRHCRLPARRQHHASGGHRRPQLQAQLRPRPHQRQNDLHCAGRRRCGRVCVSAELVDQREREQCAVHAAAGFKARGHRRRYHHRRTQGQDQHRRSSALQLGELGPAADHQRAGRGQQGRGGAGGGHHPPHHLQRVHGRGVPQAQPQRDRHHCAHHG